MEDPWGSPWTTNDFSPPKIDLPAPPPSAHFSASADHTPNRLSPARTPWDDDDAWGGWNEPGKESPRWGRSPGLRPLDGVNSGPASRLPSPSPSQDDWGKLTALEATHRRDERNGDSAINLGEGVRRQPSRDRYLVPRTLSVSPRQAATDIWKTPDAGISHESLNIPVTEPVVRPGSPDQEPPGPAMRVDTQMKTSRQSSKVLELVEMYDGIAKRSRSVSPISPPLRKTSTSPLPSVFSIPSSDEFVMKGPDTLEITSGAGNLKELDHGFEIEEAKSTTGRPYVEDVFSESLPEEVLVPKELPSKEIAASIDLEPPAEVEVHSHEDSDLSEETSGEDSEAPESPHDTPQSQAGPSPTALEQPPMEQILRPKVPPVPFTVDMSKLDDLLPSTETSFPSPEPVPDVIIDDTFRSSGERKAWYLISRAGSMRKHDMGDDDNYVRISWGSSHVREQAIRTVRRWMEEDSITGRVVLGRRTGPAGAKIFNWDSSAPPVEISELLGRKSHSRNTSTASKTTVSSPTAPAFGWSNSPVSTPAFSFPPPAANTPPALKSSAPAKSPAAHQRKKLEPINPAVEAVKGITSPTSPLAQPPQTVHSDIKEDEDEPSDDDEDWGEMVSSPTMGTNGFPPSVDQIVENSSKAVVEDGTKEKSSDNASFTDVVTPSDSAGGTGSKASSSMADWADVPRSSFDVPPSQGFIPPSLSKSSAASWSDTGRASMDALVSRGSLPPSHSKSSSVGWNRMTRISLDAVLSEDLMPNKAMPSVKEKSRPNSWAFGNVNYLAGAPKPAPLVTDTPVHTRKPLSILSNPPQVPGKDLATRSASPSTPRNPPPPSPKNSIVTEDCSEEPSPQDDEVIANILRDLPDLSYMLR